jgi:hypothetical protein
MRIVRSVRGGSSNIQASGLADGSGESVEPMIPVATRRPGRVPLQMDHRPSERRLTARRAANCT